MQIFLNAFTLFLVLLIGGIHMNSYGYDKKEISGDLAKSLAVACDYFESKLEVGWEKYAVSIEEYDRYFIVHFRAKDKPIGMRGSSKDTPEFDVKILKHDFSILESQFIR